MLYGTENRYIVLRRHISKLLLGYTVTSPRKQKMKAIKVAFSLESACPEGSK
jgi:hypothetical protein